MTSIIANEQYIRFYDPKNEGHRRWLLAVLDHVIATDPLALSRGPLRDLWSAPLEEAVASDVAMAMSLIREFEGFEEAAYPDPGTGGAPWTIGWGSTSYADGRPVRKGDRISRTDGDLLLEDWVKRIRTVQSVRIPTWHRMNAQQRAALISFAYNLGESWYGSEGFSTLTGLVGASNWAAVPKALELYRNPGTNVEAGLLRRRRAEGAFFAGGTAELPAAAPAPPKAFPNPLQVRPYLQLDSETNQAARMCFSSACAMLVEHMRPGTLKGPNGDDQYLKTVQRFGDTTSVAAQMSALRHYGIKAEFTERANFELVSSQLKAGIPVPAAYIHRGDVSAPTGFGHWLIIIGDPKPDSIIVNDPLGEPDLIGGRTLNSKGAGLAFSRKNFGRRWMVESAGSGRWRYAPGKGWAIIAKR
jgi:GH24 family phage-related lysozyme (muramidase)